MTESPPQISTDTLINTTLYVFLALFIGHLAIQSVPLGVMALIWLLASPVIVLWFPDRLLRDTSRQTTIGEFGGGA